MSKDKVESRLAEIEQALDLCALENNCADCDLKRELLTMARPSVPAQGQAELTPLQIEYADNVAASLVDSLTVTWNWDNCDPLEITKGDAYFKAKDAIVSAIKDAMRLAASRSEAQPPQDEVQQTVQPARGRDENTASIPLALETSMPTTADKSVECSADERDEKWIEAIQGAIGQMGRTGDRQYFDFCMCLIWQQAEEDGLLQPDPKHKRWLDELYPIIAKKKHLLCTAEKEIADLKEQLRAGAPAAGSAERADQDAYKRECQTLSSIAVAESAECEHEFEEVCLRCGKTIYDYIKQDKAAM